jgi:hypothetical protein
MTHQLFLLKCDKNSENLDDEFLNCLYPKSLLQTSNTSFLNVNTNKFCTFIHNLFLERTRLLEYNKL